ncbi:hypothetical protein A0H76_549 [Hepatospora eriocheir]|uniref:Uncharacterized protein n=1 Tax=Hepatospora eriocheir TaxID=1081669 RepID=A0A1X0QIK8_9MICR|nr:hypothetical protein A0H76_549 [Hepatospora eriocheir]
MNRNQKISLIDLIIRELQLKGVMLLPLSFCFHVCHNLYKKSKPKTSGIIKFDDNIYSFLKNAHKQMFMRVKKVDILKDSTKILLKKI